MSGTREMSPAGSLERDADSGKDKKVKSRRPPNTAFRQQRLKAWQPILTPKTVLPLLFCVGIIFAPIGGLLLWASAMVQELEIDYTDCGSLAPKSPKMGPLPSDRITSLFKAGDGNNEVKWSTHKINATYGRTGSRKVPTDLCTLQFSIPNDIGPPVYLYYKLTKFYQNHRRYVKSLDMQQLNGDFRSNSSIDSSDCDPLQTDDAGFAYYPCGLIANSMFNDTIHEPVLLNVPGGSSSKNQTYKMTDKGIGWSSDSALYGRSAYKPDQVVPPPYWRKRYPHYDDDEFPLPDLHNNEAFWVWMRTAGLPTFTKLARRNDDHVMRSGTYSIDVYDDFPVEKYGGTKRLLISTRTVVGGKNPYLGIAYIVVAGLCVLLGAIFTATHLIRPRKLGDHTYLTWNNDQSTGTATGRSLRPNA